MGDLPVCIDCMSVYQFSVYGGQNRASDSWDWSSRGLLTTVLEVQAGCIGRRVNALNFGDISPAPNPT